MSLRSPTDINREELEKYFDKVITCSICNKKFGVDKGRKHIGKFCPVCEKILQEKKRNMEAE